MSNDMFKYFDRHPQNDVDKDKTDENGNVVKDVLGNPIKVPISEYDLAREANDKALQETLSTLETAYGTSKNNILNNYTKAVSDADLVRNIASKYLPEQMARMGWDTNLGATTSGVNQIMANYGRDINSANETKANAMSELDIYMSDKVNEAYALRDSASATVDAEERAMKKAKYQKIIEDYIAGKGTANYAEVKEAYDSLDEYSLLDYDSAYQTKLTLTNEHGVKDTDTKISAQTTKMDAFGDFAGTGTGGRQDEWVKSIINTIASSSDKDQYNGMVFDFNIGNQKDAGSGCYVYYNGYFYKTTKAPDVYLKTGEDKKGVTSDWKWDGNKKE